MNKELEYTKKLVLIAKLYRKNLLTEKEYEKVRRRLMYSEQMMKLYIMGGGARLIEIFGDYDRDRVTFNHDIRANAKGYEYYCYMILKHQQGKKAM